MSEYTQRVIRQAAFEALEGRQLFSSVVLSSAGVLTLQGDAATPNNLTVALDARGMVVASANGGASPSSFAPSAVKSVRMIGGTGDDRLLAAGLKVPVYADGGAGNDSIVGGVGNDTLLGGAGNDTIDGADGNDLVRGGDGNDSLVGGVGDDTLFGEAGDDTMVGGAGVNVLDGGDGANTLDGVTGVPTTAGTPNPAAVKLTGAGFGTAGSWNNTGNTFNKALDGNAATYFDSSVGDGAVVGLDLGTAQVVTSARFYPRDGLAWRMVGGQFQGSNDNATWTTLGTLTAEPKQGVYSTLNFANTAAYRYVRYVAPAGGWGNVAELEFYGTAPVVTPPIVVPPPVVATPAKLTGAGFGTAGSWNDTGNTFDKALDGNGQTYFDSSVGDGAVVGLDLGTAQVITSVRFMPRAYWASRMVGGQFQGSNDSAAWTTLATVTSEPAQGQYTTLPVTDASAYRYVRYVSPAGGWGNVAEVEFYGIPTGSSAGSATGSSSGDVGTPPVVVEGAPQAVLTLLENAVTAGAAVHANAVSSALNVGTPLTARYEWDFGDPNGKYNKLVGFNAAHIYDVAGTYTVTLTVTNEAGLASTVTSTVTVSADARRTIYVDAVNGNDANNGTSSATAVRTAVKAFAMLGDNTRILFARGQTFAVTSSLYATYRNDLIGAYGTGANPVLSWQGGTEDWWEMISCGSTTRDLVVQDLGFDSGTATRPNGIAPRGTNVTIRDCQFYRLTTGINAAGGPTGLMVQDNSVPTAGTITGYFLWLLGNDSAILGNKVADGGMYAIRSSGIDGETNRSLIAYNELDHVTGSVNLRLQKGSYYYVANNVIRGKGTDFGPNGGGLGYNDPNYTTVRTTWVVMENNVAYMGTGLSENDIKVSHRAEHVMIRNNVVFRDGLGETFSINGYHPDYQAEAYDVYVLDNTVVDNDTTGTFLKVTEAELVPEITMAGNVWEAPNQVTGNNGSAILWINDPNMVSFKAIRDNIWERTATDGYANGGVIYVTPTNGGTGLLTPGQWVSLGFVSGDQFQDVVFGGGSYQYTSNGVTAGANLAAAG